LNARVKLVVTALLLCLALALTIFCAVQTVQAFQRFQQQRQLVMTRDVRAIRPWMTVPYIAYFYHVPESYLDQSLHITSDSTEHLLPLRDLAPRIKRPLAALIHDIQQAILNYRTHRSGTGVTEPGRRPQGSPPISTSTSASTKNVLGNRVVVLVEAGVGLSREGTLAVAFAPFRPIRPTKKPSVRKRASVGEETRL